MSEMQIIHQALAKAKRRRFVHRVWTGFWQGLLFGTLLWVLSIILFKLLPLPPEFLVWGQIAGASILGLRLLISFFRFDSALETARWVDEKHQLKERVSSAIEFSQKPAANDEWNELILRDAAGHAQSLNMAKALPFRIPAFSKWIVLIAVLGFGLGFVPEYRSAARKQQQVEKENIQETGREMAKVIRQELTRRPPASEPIQQSLEDAVRLGDELSRAQLKRADALKELSNMTEKLKQEARKLNQDPALKRMQEAARKPSASSASSSEALEKKINDLKEKLGGKSVDPEKLAQLRDRLEKLKQQAAALSGNNSPEAQAARNQISKSLANLNQQAMEMGLELDQLESAMEALASLETDRFLKDMDLTLDELEQMQSLAQSLQQMMKESGQMAGKDLPEQLEKGQAEAAKASLGRMIKQLQSADLNDEQLQKIMDEVSRAVSPASPYGKVAEHLRDAAQQMKQGDKADAAQSLAKAAEELDRLMDQFGDMESLAATMKALQAAQMCIGNCQGWGQCYGGVGAEGSGKRPPNVGRGFGTWTDDFGWQYYDMPETGSWDNSGLTREDMEGRGITDRGDAVLPDNLVPDKVKGQFSPGGQMPSITLKGVSIKGQSQVSYEEVVSGSQSEEQSAQNQEKVPRAYQKAVKSYFDE